MHNGDYYRSEYSDHDSAGWSAFLSGAFIGAGLALLFAPQTGRELRGMIRNYASQATDEVKERGQEAWDTAVERGQEYMERGQDALREAGRTVRDYAESGKEKVKETGKEAASKLQEAGREATNRM